MDKLLAPLVAGLTQSKPTTLAAEKITTLDRLYLGVTKALDRLATHIGLTEAA